MWALLESGMNEEQYRDFITKISDSIYLITKAAVVLQDLLEAGMIKMGGSPAVL